MRYTIMLQLVGFLTIVLLGTAIFFAWIQNRSALEHHQRDFQPFSHE